MTKRRRYIVVDDIDNVATAITDLKKGERFETKKSGEGTMLKNIRYGRKFALADIPQGEHVIKYGVQIGRATTHILRGDHVHVHNVEDIVDEVRKR